MSASAQISPISPHTQAQVAKTSFFPIVTFKALTFKGVPLIAAKQALKIPLPTSSVDKELLEPVGIIANYTFSSSYGLNW